MSATETIHLFVRSRNSLYPIQGLIVFVDLMLKFDIWDKRKCKMSATKTNAFGFVNSSKMVMVKRIRFDDLFLDQFRFVFVCFKKCIDKLFDLFPIKIYESLDVCVYVDRVHLSPLGVF